MPERHFEAHQVCGSTLAGSLTRRKGVWWPGEELHLHSRKAADLQSARLTTCPTWPGAARWHALGEEPLIAYLHLPSRPRIPNEL